MSHSLFKQSSAKSEIVQMTNKEEPKEPAKLGLFSNLFSKNDSLPKPEKQREEKEEIKSKEQEQEQPKISLFSSIVGKQSESLFTNSNSLFSKSSGLFNQSLFAENLNHSKLFANIVRPEKKEEVQPKEEPKLVVKPKQSSLFNAFSNSVTPNSSSGGYIDFILIERNL